ncbi:MAG: VanZ family protein [Clostridiales bacterium]|nr:VanZ family protein [Clostridiales bacterium]
MFFKRNAHSVLILLIALMLLFIWSNSLAGSRQSNACSGWVERWLKPLINPEGRIPEKTFDYGVRKAAHIIEYAILGALLVWITGAMEHRNVWLLLFMVLIAAVIDETIQVFTGKTSQVQDIWLDCFGAGAGMLAASCGIKVRRKRKKGMEPASLLPENRLKKPYHTGEKQMGGSKNAADDENA